MEIYEDFLFTTTLEKRLVVTNEPEVPIDGTQRRNWTQPVFSSELDIYNG